jgi:predicted metal-dependent peptidase
MATLDDKELLARVKTALNITGEYHDGRISALIADVKDYMAKAGVPAAVLNTDTVVGTIAMGVDSIMETGALSQYVISRIIQLRLTPVKEEASG